MQRIFNKEEKKKTRLTDKYKYPKYKATLKGKKCTKKICKDNKVVWMHKFPQQDIIERLQSYLIGSTNQTGPERTPSGKHIKSFEIINSLDYQSTYHSHPNCMILMSIFLLAGGKNNFVL